MAPFELGPFSFVGFQHTNRTTDDRGERVVYISSVFLPNNTLSRAELELKY